MGERFAPPDREGLHKATFKARRQLPDESSAILADDLRPLVALAFPNAPRMTSVWILLWTSLWTQCRR